MGTRPYDHRHPAFSDSSSTFFVSSVFFVLFVVAIFRFFRFFPFFSLSQKFYFLQISLTKTDPRTVKFLVFLTPKLGSLTTFVTLIIALVVVVD